MSAGVLASAGAIAGCCTANQGFFGVILAPNALLRGVVCVGEVAEVVFKYLELLRAPEGVNEQVRRSNSALTRLAAGDVGDGSCGEVVFKYLELLRAPEGVNEQVRLSLSEGLHVLMLAAQWHGCACSGYGQRQGVIIENRGFLGVVSAPNALDFGVGCVGEVAEVVFRYLELLRTRGRERAAALAAVCTQANSMSTGSSA
jgi:hypothetical protein